ncbi:WD40-repeat-containing domain protein [Gaertneriomyces semiglobifer]|nr:WD40-repeat-containing domain protein [Gaertneriomyces semiglobifer]
MSIASVSHRYVLGGICHGSLCYVDENTAVWAAGGNMVVTNLENLKQKFIPIPGGIRHLTVSSDHRIIAVAGGEGVTQWEVAGWRRRKLVVGPNGEKDFVCVAFSSDGKYLVGVEPTGGLLMWSWERGKVVGGFQFPVTEEEMQQQVELAVEDRDVCFLVGGKCYRGICGEAGVWSAEQAGDKNVSYSATLWISATETTGARLALGTTHGEIHVLSGWNIVHRIKDSRIGAITSLLGIGRGFAVAGSDGNEVILYDESERLNVREVKRVPIGEGATPWITGSGVDRAIWVVRAGGIWKFNIGETKGPGAEEASPPTLLIPGFHTASITSLDLCTRKPILMTCASDRTVRIYNYETHQMIIERTFSEELWSVALHPSGLWCLIVGGDKIRICTILDGELRINREIGVRGCRECRFSNGGHLFATTHTNIINLYHTYTFDLYTTLKGHTQRINSLQWSEDDRFLVSAGAEGAVYCWDVRDGRRVNEHVVKGNCYTSAVGGDGGGRMWCCGSDSTVKEVTESTVSVEWPSDVALTQIALSHDKKMLFTGTATGAIRALKFPLSSRPEEFQEHAAHSAPVTKLRISYDDQYLFSSAADGTVYCFRIAGGEKGVRTERNMAWADEILITKSDLEERQLLTSELNHQLTELQLEHEYQLRLCDMTYNEKLKEVTERYSGELEALKITLNNVRAEKDKEEVRREEERSMALDKHKEQVHKRSTTSNLWISTKSFSLRRRGLKGCRHRGKPS